MAELVLVTRDGTVARHSLTDGGLTRRGVLRLRDPRHTLFAPADLAPEALVERHGGVEVGAREREVERRSVLVSHVPSMPAPRWNDRRPR